MTDAIQNALENPAIDNGPTMAVIRTPKHAKAVQARPVVTTQEAVHNWKCDSCPAQGYGPTTMLLHTAKTEHSVFSAR